MQKGQKARRVIIFGMGSTSVYAALLRYSTFVAQVRLADPPPSFHSFPCRCIEHPAHPNDAHSAIWASRCTDAMTRDQLANNSCHLILIIFPGIQKHVARPFPLTSFNHILCADSHGRHVNVPATPKTRLNLSLYPRLFCSSLAHFPFGRFQVRSGGKSRPPVAASVPQVEVKRLQWDSGVGGWCAPLLPLPATHLHGASGLHAPIGASTGRPVGWLGGDFHSRFQKRVRRGRRRVGFGQQQATDGVGVPHGHVGQHP